MEKTDTGTQTRKRGAFTPTLQSLPSEDSRRSFSARYVSEDERITIADRHRSGESLRSIAAGQGAVHREPSTAPEPESGGAVPARTTSAMSRWDLPVPESPMRHKGAPLRIHSPGRQGVDGGGVDARVRIEVSEPFVPGEVGGFDAADRRASVAVVTLGQQQLSQEALVGKFFLPGDGQGFVQHRPYGGQTQAAAGLVHGRDRGLFGQPAPPAEGRVTVVAGAVGLMRCSPFTLFRRGVRCVWPATRHKP